MTDELAGETHGRKFPVEAPIRDGVEGPGPSSRRQRGNTSQVQ